MKPHYLTPLLSPKTVAVIGASETPGSVGQAVFANLLAGGFKGRLYPVNLNHRVVGGMPAVSSVRSIEAPIDLAVVTTAVRTWPGIMKECGKKGVKAVLFAKEFGDADPLAHEVMQESLAIAREYRIRVLGPNMLGLMRPTIGLNASNYNGTVRAGNLALVSHSSALCAAMLDWADAKGIGFTSVISMGDSVDLDFGEILDYLVYDNQTQGILLHLHHIHDARRFMSALRMASRTKPVVVIKSGRAAEPLSGVTTSSHLTASEDVYDAALERAGVLRVNTIAQLFTAARVLAANYRSQGDRLAIVTNGIGPGILAADAARAIGVELATLSDHTVQLFNDVLPSNWSRGNPVDIVGDASPVRFRTAVKACLDDPNVDGVLVICTPQLSTDHLNTAQLMVDLRKESNKPLLLSWLGDTKVAASRELFVRHRVAHFRAPEAAVEVFRALAAFHRNQRLLLQTPPPLQFEEVSADVAGARKLIRTALDEWRSVLSELESKALLAAFNLPVNQVRLARTSAEAVAYAEEFGYPVVLKIDSPDVIYKSDVGGVELNLRTEAAVRAMFEAILERTRQHRPDARINGILVQPMTRPRYGRELMVGVTHDDSFGPVMTFGMGGIAVEVLNDTSIALPPLNDYLAERMIEQTRVRTILGAFKNMPPVRLDAIRQVLLRVSEMVCALPELWEMDINPLIADENGVVALDARVVIREAGSERRFGHMSIMPYPADRAHSAKLSDGSIVQIRPMRPEDADMQQEFVRNLSDESRYNRYMSSIKQLSQQLLVRFTQLDYDREMAFVMLHDTPRGTEQIAVSRYFMESDNETCEFALVVADNWQGKGIGPVMMQAIFDAAREQGLKIMYGEVLASNKGMLKLMHKLGFRVEPHPEDRSLTLCTLDLTQPNPAG